LIEFLLFVIAWRLWFKTEQKTYSKLPTESEQAKIQIVIIKTLLRYPESPIGNDYPEIRYQVLCELYSRGEISKEYLHSQIDKII
jgi:hypothetical protein